MRGCKIEGCTRTRIKARGMCAMHYGRWYLTGDPGPAHSLKEPHVTAHGTYNEYQNYGCRCELCKAAMAEWNREHLLTDKCTECGKPIWHHTNRTGLCKACSAAARRTPIEELHGTETGYSRGCKCAECRRAATDARRRRRQAMTPLQQEAQRRKDRERRVATMTPLQRVTSRIAARAS